MTDWTKQIGRKVRVEGGFSTFTLREFGVDAEGEFWKIDEVETKWRSAELVPEFEPKRGDWVMWGGMYPFLCRFPLNNKGGDGEDQYKYYRPLTDEEKIDIVGGIDEIERLFDTLRHR